MIPCYEQFLYRTENPDGSPRDGLTTLAISQLRDGSPKFIWREYRGDTWILKRIPGRSVPERPWPAALSRELRVYL